MTPEQKLTIRLITAGIGPTVRDIQRVSSIVKKLGVSTEEAQKIMKRGLGFKGEAGNIKEYAKALRTAAKEQRKLNDELRRLEQKQLTKDFGAARRQIQPTIVSGGLSIIQQNTGLSGFSRMLGVVGQDIVAVSRKMISWGKNTQWLGRQLMFNVTLPLVALGTKSVQMALEVDNAWIRVKKVYGDTAEEAAKFAQVQVDVLKPAVTDIVRTFGEQRKVVIELMGDWAAMGFAGEELAKITEETFRIMTLGELEAADATKTIRTLMATYGLTVEEAAVELNAFNKIENVTSLQFKDLAQAFPEVVAVFESFNISAREGAAILAGMHERGLNANESATALKFTLTKLQAPTDKAMEAFAKYNIEIFNANGSMKDGIPVLRAFAEKVGEMTEEEQALFINTSAGRRQVNRFVQMLKSVEDPASAFSRSMELAADDVNNLEAAEKELNDILESKGVKLKIATEKLRDLGIELGLKLLPHVINAVEWLGRVLEKFNKLSPQTQEWIIKILLVIAALGPLMVILASAVQVLGVFGGAIGHVISAVSTLITFITASGGIVPALQVLGATLASPFVLVLVGFAILAVIIKQVNDLRGALIDLEFQMGRLDRAMSISKQQDILLAQRNLGIIPEDLFQKRFRSLRRSSGGFIEKIKYASGGIVGAANGLVAGSSALRDRVPAMLTPGELVLNKDQQKSLLSGGTGSTNITTNVNINVGTMIASPGERREFARMIEKLTNQNMARLATG